jgi:hypothetical protein
MKPDATQIGDTFIDRENAFMLYATFCGDLNRTAHALKIQPVDVLRIADADHWNEKLAPILELNRSTRPGDVERAINRAINFVQAARLRHVVERAIRLLYTMGDQEFGDKVFARMPMTNGQSCQLTAKGLADLATAMEKVQAMTYQALTDTSSDRKQRLPEKGGAAAGDFHVRIADAMARVKGSNSIRAELFDQQLAEAKALLAEPCGDKKEDPKR